MTCQFYFIWGEEEYLIEREVEEIIKNVGKTTGDEPERVVVDAGELDTAGLAQTLEFTPLFALSRVVILRHPPWLGKGNRKTKKVDEICRTLNDCRENGGDGQTVVLTATEHISTSPVVKWLDGNAQVIHCQTPDRNYLRKWLEGEFSRHRTEINPAALNLLARSGLDMFYLENLVEKICLIVQERAVNEKDITEQLTLKQEINVFRLTDGLMNSDLAGSMDAYRQLLVQGNNPVYLLYMIVRQFFLLGQIKCCQESGFSSKQIAEITHQKEFAVRRIIGKCSDFTHEQIKTIMEMLLQTDIGFKTTGKNPELLMEMLIIGICSQNK